MKRLGLLIFMLVLLLGAMLPPALASGNDAYPHLRIIVYNANNLSKIYYDRIISYKSNVSDSFNVSVPGDMVNFLVKCGYFEKFGGGGTYYDCRVYYTYTGDWRRETDFIGGLWPSESYFKYCHCYIGGDATELLQDFFRTQSDPSTCWGNYDTWWCERAIRKITYKHYPIGIVALAGRLHQSGGNESSKTSAPIPLGVYALLVALFIALTLKNRT